MKFFPFPLRFSIPVILLLFGTILSAVFFQRETSLARDRVEANITQQAIFAGNQTSGLFEYLYQNQDRRGIDLVIGQLGSAPNINIAVLFDEGDLVLWSTRLQLRDRPLSKTPVASLEEIIKTVRDKQSGQVFTTTNRENIWAIHPVGLEFNAGEILSSRMGILAIKYNLKTEQAIAYHDAATRSISYGIAIYILGTLLWFFFDRTLTKRALKLVETSNFLAQGNLSIRSDLNGSDELSLIAIAFNKMAVEIQKNNEALQKTLTELKRAQTQLIQAEKMSGLGQVVAGVAHEINNPINFIYGNIPHIAQYIEDLLEILNCYQNYYPNPFPEVEDKLEEIDFEFINSDLPKILNSIRGGTNRVKEIVVGLRTFSRLDEAENKIVNIHQSIDSTILFLQHRFKSDRSIPEIQIVKSYNDLPEIECYAGQLNQVFLNILNNSVDALIETARENREFQDPTIYIQTQLIDNTWVQIAIADNGKGISPETKKCIFDPFFTTKPIGSGTGLGLSIAYQIIVEKHGGKLECHSVIGEGVKFIIEIPLHLDRAHPQTELHSLL